MSDDLISRKVLMEKAKDYFISPDGALRLIESQPTAYDVDKVCGRLEDYLFEKYCIEGDMKIDEIVKSGGVADD